MSNKKILIPGWSMGPNSFGVTLPYLHYLSDFGDVLIATPTKEIHENIDLVILPGGKDLPSYRYDQPPSYYNTDPDLFKEYFYMKNLPKYIEAGVPVFGICLGFQQLAVYFGGKLIQNCGHTYSDDKNRGELVHNIKFTKKFEEFGKSIGYPKGITKVNSLHHQGISVGLLPDVLDPIAYSHEDDKNNMDDCIVEAFQHVDLPIAAVQYHPEEIFDNLSIYLIQYLLTYSEQTVE